MPSSRRKLALLALLAVVALPCLCSARTAQAWIVHEHEEVVRAGIGELEGRDGEAVGRLAELWERARGRIANNLCEGVDDASRLGECLSYAALAALAGDHSCDPADLRRSLGQAWTAEVIDIGIRFGEELREHDANGDRGEHLDAWRRINFELQFTDRKYLSRAASNAAHFLVDRETDHPHAYLRDALRHQDANAIATFAIYHAAALVAVDRARQAEDREQAAEHAVEALLSEAFALHFLSDAFSSGHFVGAWGDRSTRMGTHDYYSEVGVDARTWHGDSYAAHGDSFLGPEDLEKAAPAIARSLEQLAFVWERGLDALPHLDAERMREGVAAEHFDSCGRSNESGAGSLASTRTMREVVEMTPVPATLAAPLPRFPNELGIYYSPRADLALRGNFEDGPFDSFPLRTRVGLGLGLALDGIAERGLDGELELAAVLLADGSAPNSDGTVRPGGGLEFHLPFVFLPVADMVLVAPLLGLIDWAAGTDMATRFLYWAARGGFFATGAQAQFRIGGRVYGQFVLGREGTVGVFADGVSRSQTGSEDLGFADAIGVSGDNRAYWHVQLPVLAVRFRHYYSGPLALVPTGQLGVDASFESWDFGSLDDRQWRIGAYVSYGFKTRRYFWRP